MPSEDDNIEETYGVLRDVFEDKISLAEAVRICGNIRSCYALKKMILSGEDIREFYLTIIFIIREIPVELGEYVTRSLWGLVLNEDKIVAMRASHLISDSVTLADSQSVLDLITRDFANNEVGRPVRLLIDRLNENFLTALWLESQDSVASDLTNFLWDELQRRSSGLPAL